MKKVKKGYMKKLCALVLTLCMVIGQTQGVWADELGSVSAAEATEVSEAADATAQAVEAEEITDEAANAAEEPEGITYQEQKIEELVQERALNAGETGDLFTYEHLDFRPLKPDLGTINYYYTGSEVKPHFELIWTPSSNEVSGNSASGNSASGNSASGNSASGNSVILEEGVDYEIAGYKDNTNIGLATVTFRGLGKYESKATGAEPIEWYFFIVTNPKKVEIISANTTIKVKNSQGTASENTIYVAVVSQNGVGDEMVTGTEVRANENETVEINTYSYLDANNKVAIGKLQPETTYHIYAWEYNEFPVAAKYIEDFGICDLGTKTTGKSPIGPGVSINLIPGNNDNIKFKAATQKNQSVKLSWTPAKAKGYKTYSVYRLNEGSTILDDEKAWTLLPKAENIKAKAYTDNQDILKIGRNAAKTGIYKLVAKSDSATDSYVMIASPWLFKTESGEVAGTQDYYMTALKASGYLSYELQAASAKNGFDDNGKDKTSVIESEGLYVDSYKVNKNLAVDGVSPIYTAGGVEVGNKFFFRTRARFKYGDLDLVSYPSNVLSRKVGPAKCTVMDISGLTMQEQLEKMDENYFEQLKEGKDVVMSGVHADSPGTCWKTGYVLFHFDGSTSGVKQFQLLRATKEDGKYSVVKKFSPSQAKPIDFKNDKMQTLKENIGEAAFTQLQNYFKDCYWIDYNNFVPEVTYYYTVKAISNAGNAAGNYGPGFENTTRYEKVQNFEVGDSTGGNIYLYWKHDDCAKEYWIYRSETQDGLKNVNVSKPLKKVKASKPLEEVISGNTIKYHEFYDNSVKLETDYWYMVRPVYKANKKTFEEFEYSVAMSDKPVQASTKGTFINDVKTSVYSVKQVQVKWGAVVKAKNTKAVIDGYQIAAYEDIDMKIPAGTPVIVSKSDTKAFKKRTAVIEVPKVGKIYYFNVKPMTNGQVNDEFGLGAKEPCATHPLKVAGLKASKQSGSLFARGAKVTFKLNEKDQPYADGLSYVILSDGVMVDSGEFYSFLSKEAYIDSEYLSRGTWRNYKVYAVYTDPDKEGNPVGETASVNYGKPNSVDIGDDKTLDADEEKTIEATFKCGGKKASVQDYDSVKSSDSDIVKVKSVTVEDGKVKIKLKAGNKSGSARITIKGYQSGPSDSMKVIVKKKSSSSSSVWRGY